MKKIFSIAFLFLMVAAHAQKPVVYTDARGKKGYKDAQGKIIVPAKYSQAYADFYAGLAKVRLNGKYGFINKQGIEIINPQYDSASEFSYFGNADVVLGKKQLRIDTTGKSVAFDPKTFSARDFDFADFDFSQFDYNVANKMKALGQANVICDRFTSGNYNGEVFNDIKPGGYGCYVFSDSSFYCGLSDNGSVNGNGVFYDKTNKTISVGKWSNGKLTNDYYLIRLDDYKVQIYSATTGAPQYRAGMQVTGKFLITSNLLHPYASEKHNLINILDASGVSTMYGKTDNDLLLHGNYASFDSKDQVLKVNSSNHGVYVNSVSTAGLDASSVEKNAENNLGYALPTMLYPKRLINNYDKTESYFGKVDGSSPKGFGSLTSQGDNYHLTTSMFNASGAQGFKEEIVNLEENKYFYAGDFQTAHIAGKIAHSGNGYAKIVYYTTNDVCLSFGDFKNSDNAESLVKGIIVNVRPGFSSILFITNEGNESKTDIGKGYLMLPKKNVVYRGGLNLVNSNADGVGEVSSISGNSKGRYAAGKSVEELTESPGWSIPIFQTMFNSPFKLIEDK